MNLYVTYLSNTEVVQTFDGKYLCYHQKDQQYQLSEYVGEIGDIVDPFGGSIDTYRQTFEQLLYFMHICHR
jgi:protein-tyrosine-phosphatase